jgi:hypothetical protein
MAKTPRAVLVSRPSDYELLLGRHGTRGQAAFFLERQGIPLAALEAAHERQHAALAAVRRQVPETWRCTSVSRTDLDRFLFEPDDLVVAVGQDGLVANVAKYLSGQLVLGINPAPDCVAGVLACHEPGRAGKLLRDAAARAIHVEQRTMVEARLDDGQRLLCLNEVFVGHASHQSARYVLKAGDAHERQSSSGLIVTTGTGASGWARSIHQATRSRLALPAPAAPALAFFVREPWPSPATGTELCEGRLEGSAVLTVVSEMDDRGVIFGDGMEQDCLPFGYGQRVHIQRAARSLNLVPG